jgi:SecD/SecF fusion protein
MPQNYTGRVLLILGLILVALLVLLPPGSLFNSEVPWGKKINLKPGIDMAGGTRLIYEIKTPPDGAPRGDLAEQVMISLKMRVDPKGVRNLVWRPQGSNRLEIQMPISGQSVEAQKTRAEYLEAQQALEATNLRLPEVRRAVEKLKAEDRQAAFQKLAMGSDRRAQLLGSMASAFDRLKQAETKRDFDQQADLQIEYENYRRQLEKTNLTTGELEGILQGTPKARAEALAKLRETYADFPARIAAMERLISAFDRYGKIRGQLDDASDLKRLVSGSGVLSFHILVEGEDLESGMARAMRERLMPGGRGTSVQAGDEMRWFAVDRPSDMHTPVVEYNEKHWALCWTTPEKSMTNPPGNQRWALEHAAPTQDQRGIVAVEFRFDAAGGTLFHELTRSNVGRTLTAILDEKVISAATIQTAIGRVGIITRGNGYSKAELDYLVNTLRAGSLPAKLTEEPISEQTVGPTIGQDNLKRGLYACLFGLVVVAIFFVGYYYFSGVVATFAVLLNTLFILAMMAALGATFTLPGVAGIVLTIGMAVDANVLIFERLREEQQRGMSLRMALRNAYDRALSAIVDSNVTTAITAAVLYIVGSEEVKGFGLTLMLGMFSSLFTALFVTKTIFGLMIDKGGMKSLGSLPLSFPRWDRALRPKIDWMRIAPIFYVLSTAFIVVGLALFSIRSYQGHMLDIEFTSGTSVTFELKQKMSIDQVRRLIDRADPVALPSPSVQSVGHDDRTYQVLTPNDKGAEVKAAVIAAMGDTLLIQRSSTYTGSDLTPLAAREFILPITGDELEVDGQEIEGAYRFQDGVAFILRNLQPALTADEVKSRIERQRLQPAAGAPLPFREMSVEMVKSTRAGESDTAVVLIADPALPYSKDPAKWEQELAAPLWTLVHDAISRPEELQQVTNFDPQVAVNTSIGAGVALGLSIIVIMAYIWVRFGNLTYGSATVVACAHDTLFTLAAVGFAHYLADSAFGQALMLEAFRVNLTLVAGVLTVLGYSMNDTVVVFDRIRENRGKQGELTPAIVNDSINQTLSRTLLTGGTTIVTILVMYIAGGAGIHGFTFVLLGGILVGTYSSIAIAAPILLLRAPKTPAGYRQPSTPSTKA